MHFDITTKILEYKVNKEHLGMAPADDLAPQTSKTEFSTLNDDCIFVIFDWLSSDDLCSIGQTCNRLHKLAADQFHRKYPEKVMNEFCLRISNGEITMLPNENYIKCFSKYIYNLKIQLMQRCTETDILCAVEFMRQKCSSNLVRIRFNCFYLPASFGTSIKDFLKTVEIVEFIHCNGQSNYYDSILKHCPKLKHLTTDGCSHDTDMNGLLLRQNPTLEHFDYGFGNDFCSDKLMIFFQQNTNIKSLAWWLYNEHSSTLWPNACIKCIVSNATNLECLYLSVTNSFNFLTICELRNLCDRDNFKRLEIQFLGDNATKILIDQGNEFALLKKFSKIHLSAAGLRCALPILNSSLHQINSVYVNSVCRDLTLSDNDLPNVEELHFSEIPDDNSLVHIVRHLVKLKNIFIPKNLLFTENYIVDILQLNVEREKLSDASPLVIYTNHPKNPTNFSHNLVKLKQIKFEKSYNIKFGNPFLMYSMVNT